MMYNEPHHMWRIYFEKHGLEHALKTFYPRTLKNHPIIETALDQIKIAQLAIHSLMAELGQLPENDEDLL